MPEGVTVVAAVGLYGKLPALGDFVQRGFSSGLTEALDKLTQTAISSAVAEGATRETLQATSNTCIIHVRPGAIADSGFAGCMAPSCDRVGRFFPIFAGVELAPTRLGEARPAASWTSAAFGASLCATVYDAQAARSGPDELLMQLPDSAAWCRASDPDQVPFARDGDSTVPAILPSQSQFAFIGPEHRMSPADRAMCSRLPHISEMVGAVITVGTQFDLFFATRSLLAWSSLAALFDGRWAHWGWELQSAPASDDDDCTLAPPAERDD